MVAFAEYPISASDEYDGIEEKSGIHSEKKNKRQFRMIASQLLLYKRLLVKGRRSIQEEKWRKKFIKNYWLCVI
jgi:hypothetical protein